MPKSTLSTLLSLKSGDLYHSWNRVITGKVRIILLPEHLCRTARSSARTSTASPMACKTLAYRSAAMPGISHQLGVYASVHAPEARSRLTLHFVLGNPYLRQLLLGKAKETVRTRHGILQQAIELVIIHPALAIHHEQGVEDQAFFGTLQIGSRPLIVPIPGIAAILKQIMLAIRMTALLSPMNHEILIMLATYTEIEHNIPP